MSMNNMLRYVSRTRDKEAEANKILLEGETKGEETMGEPLRR